MKINNIVFASRSAPFVADSIARIYGSNYFRWSKLLMLVNKNKLNRKLGLCLIGLYYKDKDALKNYISLFKHFSSVAIIFAGTDVLQLKASPERAVLFKMIEKYGVKLYAVGENLSKEVNNTFGLNVEKLGLPVVHNFPNVPPQLKDEFMVGCYVPLQSKEFYGFNIIKESARIDRSIHYNIYSLAGGGRGEYGLLKMSDQNIIIHEKRIESKDMPNFIGEMSCGLRITEHDGHPMSIAEYIMMGRYFVFNDDMPYCSYVSGKSAEEIVGVLHEIRDKKVLNVEGMRYYSSMHSQESFKKNITRVLSKNGTK